jgi:hypothetical protein
LATHPAAKAFVENPKPIPTSFARQVYFAITAFKFTNAARQSRFGRFRLRPEARYVLDEWRAEYNHRSPHSGLGWQTQQRTPRS